MVEHDNIMVGYMNINCNRPLTMSPNGVNICLTNTLSMGDFENYSFKFYWSSRNKKLPHILVH